MSKKQAEENGRIITLQEYQTDFINWINLFLTSHSNEDSSEQCCPQIYNRKTGALSVKAPVFLL
jgi:hypothetical protein